MSVFFYFYYILKKGFWAKPIKTWTNRTIKRKALEWFVSDEPNPGADLQIIQSKGDPTHRDVTRLNWLLSNF